jgi:hypothetical protein
VFLVSNELFFFLPALSLAKSAREKSVPRASRVAGKSRLKPCENERGNFFTTRNDRKAALKTIARTLDSPSYFFARYLWIQI